MTATAGGQARHYRPLAFCLSVATHLAALLLLSQHTGSQGAYPYTKPQMQTQVARLLHVSLLQPPSSLAATASTVPSSIPLQVGDALTVPPVQKPSHHPKEAPAPLQGISENILDTPQPPSPAETSSGALPEPRYYLLRELSVRPTVLQDATASLAFEGVPAQTVILRLFINEEGGIDRVAAEQSVLPEAHAQRLIDAFAQARFLPGQLDGVPVKSQMRVEVRLESAPQRDVSLQ